MDPESWAELTAKNHDGVRILFVRTQLAEDRRYRLLPDPVQLYVPGQSLVMFLLRWRRCQRTLRLYFCMLHKDEYCTVPALENRYIPPSPSFNNVELVNELPDDLSVISTIVLHRPRREWTERDYDKALIAMLCLEALQGPHTYTRLTGAGSSVRDIPTELVNTPRRRAMYSISLFVGWFKVEISPENWAHSFVPDMLGLRPEPPQA